MQRTANAATAATRLHCTKLHSLRELHYHYTKLCSLHYTALKDRTTTNTATTTTTLTLYYTILYSMLHCTINTRLHHNATLHSIPLHSIPFHPSPFHSTPLRSTQPHYTTLHYTALIAATATTTSMLLYATLRYCSLHYTTLVAPPHTQLELHDTSYYTLHHNYNSTNFTTTTTVSLHHTTASSCARGDRAGVIATSVTLAKNTAPTTFRSVHQWLRSAIRDSQQPRSPLGFLC